MRIDTIELSGWAAFPSTVQLDLRDLPGIITAVCGPNGAGKTTLCSLGVLAPWYRKIPDQSPNDLARRDDTHVKITGGLKGQALTIEHVFDASGGGSCIVRDETKEPIDACRSGGIKEFKRWSAENLPDYAVVTASTYMGQGARGLLKMTDGQRGGVILRAMGSDELERLAKGARDAARVAEAELVRVVDRLTGERERSGDPTKTADRLDDAKDDLSVARAGVTVARATLADAEAAQRAATRLRVASDHVQRLDVTLAPSRRLVDRSATIRTDLANRHGAMNVVTEARAQAESHSASCDAAHALASAAAAAREGAERRKAATQARMTEARERGGFRLAQALTTRATHARGVRDARDLLSTADAVHAAVARTHVIVVDFARWRAELVGALTEQGATVATVARNERDMRVARAALASAVARRSTFSRTIERLTGAEDAALALPAARETVALAEVKLATTTAYVEQLRVDERMVMMRRHAALREGLRMLCEEQGIRPEETADEVYAIACAVARHAVREDERLLAEATELPARIEAAIMSSAAADEARKQVHAACADLAARAAQFDELQRARDEHHEAEHDVSRCHDDLTAAEFVVTSDPERLAHVEHKILTLRATCAALSDERSCLAPLVANAALLVAASERAAHEETAHATSQIEVTAAEEEVAASRAQEGPAIAAAVADVVTAAASEREHLDAALQANAALDGALATMASAQRAVDAVDPRLEEQFATAEASLMAMSVEVEAAATELAAAKDTGVLVASDGPSVPIAEALCVEASQATEDAAAAVVRAEEAHAQAVAAATRIAEMTMTRAAAEEDLADWNELASDLGRHGLQSDLIDSAAPALTAMANDLLRSAGVTRWTVKFTTESVNSDGEMVPGFPLLVHDALTGETREARTFSGGETVLLDAGVANAVAALACTRAGIHEPVLVRDESGAQLDPENEVAWIAMLRRTAAITRASRVFVVTHAPSLRAMCDSVVWVGKGAITVGDEPPVAA